MEFLIPLFSEPAFFYPPQSFFGWALWVVWWGIILLALRRWRSFDVAFSKDKGSLFLVYW
jgi:hypothetical protein